MKKLGIIGGMGPLATQLLYKEITNNTVAECDQDHIDMIILSHASMPDRTGAILSGDTKKIEDLLAKDAQFLEKSGAQMIAIPCNTSHYFWQHLQDSVKIPVLNMIKSTCEFAAKRGIKKLGVLATDGTIRTGLYEKECIAAGIEYFAPDAECQNLVMNIIYEQIKKGMRGSDKDFAVIDKHLRDNGCDGAVLACTELSCYADESRLSPFYIDALTVLANEAIVKCGAKQKNM